MTVTFARIGSHQTVTFAFRELSRILSEMDPSLKVDSRLYAEYDQTVENVIWLGVSPKEKVSGKESIDISVKKGEGHIFGSENRAVLIASYRFLFELGCRFLRPGKEGEKIPRKTLSSQVLSCKVKESASYRHRGVCIEGAVSYRHVFNMIDFLPKVGMNGYFSQFHTPATFFKRYYNAEPTEGKKPVTDEDVNHLWQSLEEELFLRSLDYHATGHGWTCAPFGIESSGWERQKDEDMPPEALKVMAKLNGKRGLFRNVPLNTNLCYSDPEVRKKMICAIVDYLKEHPKVDFLHFWLADGKNNHCECEECRKMLPSDYYVLTLNELDEKLTAQGIQTKIVCLIYVDLLWEPKTEKIRNPDRFVLMFAPITRTYTRAFSDATREEVPQLAPYRRNQNVMPTSVSENLARLKKWQEEQLSGDSFDFDYHLMWDHHLDPGYYECARILHKDMTGLDKIGLDGMMSCQLQRTFLPTGLPFYAMAKGLWDQDSSFEDVAKEYFSAAFGEDGETVQAYLSDLSRLFDPEYLRREKPLDPKGYEEKMRLAMKRIEEFEAEVLSRKGTENPEWALLCHHAKMAKAHARMLTAFLGPDSTPEKRERAKEEIQRFFKEMEKDVEDVFDPVIYNRIFGRTLKKFHPDDL